MPVLSTALPQEVFHPPTWLSIVRWNKTSSESAVEAERKLLQMCRSSLTISNTLIGERQKGMYIHSISGGSKTAQPIVCLQGYGAGAAIYYRNMDFMCQHFQMHCVDWLGTGLSGRPKFTAKNTEETEEFFIRGLKAWYDQQGLGKVILMGHSLGGYLAALYAKRYPEDVKHLILVSPAAVAGKPDDYELPAILKSWSWQGILFKTFKSMFQNGITPQMLVRSMGPWGEGFVGRYVGARFREGIGIKEHEAEALQSYFYHISAAMPSGEHALRHIFHPIAWGKKPLEGRMEDLKVPVSFIYGESDWMDYKSAHRVCRSIERTSREKKNEADRRVRRIPEAGHFVFLDQPVSIHFVYINLISSRNCLTKSCLKSVKQLRSDSWLRLCLERLEDFYSFGYA